MTDDLKTLLEAAVERYRPGEPDPEDARRRAHRRQRRRKVVAAVVALCIASASTALVVSTFKAGAPRAADTDEPSRTALLGPGVRITAPAGWSLVDRWSQATATETRRCRDDRAESALCIPVDRGEPILQLSNTDLGLDGDLCHGSARAIGPRSVVLYVAYDIDALAVPGDLARRTWPVPLRTAPGCTELPQGGDMLSARWLDTAGTPYVAYAYIGNRVSGTDREILMRSFASMSFEPARLEPSRVRQSAYVVAAGSFDGVAWNLEVTARGGVALVVPRASDGGVVTPFATDLIDGLVVSVSRDRTIAWGAVPPTASVVEARAGDGDAIQATIVPLDAHGLGYSAFVVPISDPAGTTITALDTSGAILAQRSVAPRATETTMVPDVVGIRGGTAEKILRRSGFEVDVQVVPGTYTNGGVIEQDPAPNTFVERQAAVTIVIGPLARDEERVYLGNLLFSGRTNDCRWKLYAEAFRSSGGLVSLIADDGTVLHQDLVYTGSASKPLDLSSFTCEGSEPGQLVFGLIGPDVSEVEWIDAAQDTRSPISDLDCLPSPFPSGFCFLLEDSSSRVDVVAFDASGEQIDRASFDLVGGRARAA
jgi:hypothetical protein